MSFSGSTVNIGGQDTHDPFHRYKRPKLMFGLRKGHSCISNMDEVSKALHATPRDVTKYLQLRLSCPARYDRKHGLTVISGRPQAARLEDVVSQFARTFVLCAACHKPEIELSVEQCKRVVVCCASCGHLDEVPAERKVDQKMARYLVSQVNNKKRNRRKGRGKRKGPDSPASADKPSVQSHGDYFGVSAVSPEPNACKDDNDLSAEELEWSTSVDEKELEENAHLARSLDGTDDCEMPDTPTSFVRSLLLSKDATAVVGELRRLALARGLTPDRQMATLLTAMLVDEHAPDKRLKAKAVLHSVREHIDVFQMVVGQYPAAAALLGAFAEFVVVDHPHLLPSSPVLLQALYHGDVLEEDVVLRWYQTARTAGASVAERKMADACAGFVEWLQSSDDSESD